MLAAFIFFYPMWTAMPQSAADQQMRSLGRRRVTAFLVILDAALTLAAGAALAGLVRTHLTFAERSLIGITSGLLVGTAATYGLALLTALTTLTVLAGPALVLVVGLLVSLLTVNPRATWHASWVESRDRWTRRIPWLAIGSLISGAAIVAAIFAHTVYSDAGGSRPAIQLCGRTGRST